MNESATLTRLLTRKSALSETRLETHAVRVAPTPGELWLKLDRFALTTNNITYAAYGDAMQYWNFFPTGQSEWGHMPVWGFADVLASGVQGIEPGERFYGYFPIATQIRMQPVRVTARGFYDGSEHRLGLVSAYNQYTRCSSDPSYSGADEHAQMLLRPLFITSYMLADFLQDNTYFGARRLVVSSASSKTAYGTAFCLQDQAGLELVALTSERNRGFVEGLGCYSRTLGYEALETLDRDTATLYIDFSGDERLRSQIHHHLGSALVYDCFAGTAQNTAVPEQRELPGPKPAPYFAPNQIRKRNKDWGPELVNQRFGDAQRRFIRHVSDRGWLKIVEHRGFDGAQQLIRDLHDGRADPQEGYIVRLD